MERNHVAVTGENPSHTHTSLTTSVVSFSELRLQKVYNLLALLLRQRLLLSLDGSESRCSSTSLIQRSFLLTVRRGAVRDIISCYALQTMR